MAKEPEIKSVENDMDVVNADEKTVNMYKSAFKLVNMLSPAPSVARKLKALKQLQLTQTNLESQFYKELHELEAKYYKKYATYYEKRGTIITGAYEPTDEECVWESDDEEECLSNAFEKSANIVSEEETEKNKKPESDDADKKKEEEDIKGIPEFWLTIFKNVSILSEMVQEHDEPILKHLYDIRTEYLDEGFKLEFHFSPNEYFSNSVLTKEYSMRFKPEEKDPFSYEGPEIIKTKGCLIDWKKGKNVTLKIVKKNQKHKSKGSMRTVTKTVQNDSFFNFFNPPIVPDDEDAEVDDETQAILNSDFEIGHYIRERIIHRAVLYYTGEALEDEDDDYSDDDAEEEEEEIDEEEEEEYEDSTSANNTAKLNNASFTMHESSESSSFDTISNVVGNALLSGMELLSQVSLGQSILKVFDRGLWIIEKTTQWSLPVPETSHEENGKLHASVELVRPLPWIFFIPALIILRLTRFAINTGTALLSRPQIGPHDIISFMQKVRSHIKVIKSNGLKVIKEKVSETEIEPTKEEAAFLEKVLNTPDNDVKMEKVQLIEAPEESEDENEALIKKIQQLAQKDRENVEYIFNALDSDEDVVDSPESKIEELMNDIDTEMKSITEEERLKRDTRVETVDSKGHYPAEKFEIDGDVTYYSPISSTSDSPERSGTPIKSHKDLVNRGYVGKHKYQGNEENGGVHYVIPCAQLDKLLCSDDGTNDNVRNGQNEEKRHGRSSKSHHKNKRSNCASRKKK